MSVDLAGARASCLCHGFGLRWFGSSLAWCLACATVLVSGVRFLASRVPACATRRF